jgi:NAD(P)-dependent dehydrogenase (short-subunit alcohol dehydrogenase family)
MKPCARRWRKHSELCDQERLQPVHYSLTMKSVLITGASTGIGETCALLLADRGWQVLAGVRTDADAKRLQAASDKITPLQLDVTIPSEIQEAAKLVSKTVGDQGLQGLVNNAGIAVAGPLEFLQIDELRRQFDVNFIGLVELTQAFIPQLRNGHGRVVNISSIGGRATSPFNVAYSASKHALEALTDGLRRELVPWKIHVASVEPGSIDTPIWKKSLNAADAMRANLPAEAEMLYGIAMERARHQAVAAAASGIPPMDVARVVYHALSAPKPHTRYIVGRGTKLAIWLIRFLPDEWVDWAIGRVLYRSK